MGIAYKLALKPSLPLTAFNFAIKALRRYHVSIIKGIVTAKLQDLWKNTTLDFFPCLSFV